MITLALALAVAQPATPAPAPPAASTPTSDKAAIAAAQRLLDATGIERQYDDILAKMIPLMAHQVFGSLKDNVTVPAKLRTFLADEENRGRATRIFNEEAAAAFRARYPTMRDATAREYARIFTAQELDELTAFYATPLGAKALRSVPEIQNQLMPIGVAAGADAGRIAMTRMVEKLGLDQEATPRS